MRIRPLAVLLILLVCGAATLALWPALRALDLFSSLYDWRYFETMLEMSRRTVVWYHQAPLWNPYSCGGEVDLANPQALSGAPTFPLVLLLGTAAGIKAMLWIHYVLALAGGYLLGRHLGLSVVGALLAGLGFGLSGYLAQHTAAGHINFAGVALYPILIWCYERSLREAEWVVPLGLGAAWVTLLGGTFTPPMAGVLLLLWAGLHAIERRSLRPLWPLPVAAGLALLCGAVRLLPVLEFLLDHPRPAFRRTPDVSMPWDVLGDLVAWRGLHGLAGRKYWAHEYTAKLAWVLMPLVLASLRFWGQKLVRRLWIFALLSALLSMGNFAPFAPWSLLQRLPILRDLRVPSRHLVLLTLALPLLAGIGWDQGRAWLIARRPGWQRGMAILGAALVFLCCAEGVVYTAWRYQGVFTVQLSIPPGPVPFYQVHGSWRTMRETLFAGHGSIDTPGAREPGCDEEAPLQRAEALDAGDVEQARLLDPGAGAVKAARFTPNVREIDVELARPTTLLINSNWNEHFKAEPGRITRVAGRLAVDLAGLPPGPHTVVVRYAPRTFTIGAGLTAVLLPLLLSFFFWRRQMRKRGLL
jgi:hypothetical protein